MSSDVAIQVENLGKQYRLGEFDPRRTFRESLRHWVAAPARTVRSFGRATATPQPAKSRPKHQTIWALRDVTVDVAQGQVLGIIGRNGAGKSTLLKILSKITKPTTGRVRIHGRLGSLLEVGTGFHPELTGRENVFLNGAILGMRRAEIKRKFDEIVAFSGVEEFLDTPIKRYSSGMNVRLAFSVAAHLEPEILVIDEVLAVGDLEFQKKCLGKMDDVAKGGRTVLFVSHSMGAVANLCNRVLLIESGKVILDGEPSEVIADYIASVGSAPAQRTWDLDSAPGSSTAKIKSVRLLSNGEVSADVPIDQPLEVEVDYWNLRPGSRLSCGMGLHAPSGEFVLWSPNRPSAILMPDEWFNRPAPPGLYRSRCIVPPNLLNEGRYTVTAKILSDVFHQEADAPHAVSFTVHETGRMRAEYSGHWAGMVRPILDWQTEQVEDGVEG